MPTKDLNMVAMNYVIELSERIARDFRPMQVILFGSHAAGTAAVRFEACVLVPLSV